MKFLTTAFRDIAALAALARSQKVSYDGFQVVRLDVGDDVAGVDGLVKSLDLTRWGAAPSPGQSVDLVVPPEKIASFHDSIGEAKFTMMHDDLGASIAREAEFPGYAASSANSSWFDAYHPYADHIQWLHDLQALHANNTEILEVGRSQEGNEIMGIHIFSDVSQPKPAVVFHGTVHAREWISTLVVEYITYALLAPPGSTQPPTKACTMAKLLAQYDFYILPIVNPDGFIYTQTTDRLWRKNRQPNAASPACVGRDINRNWASHWDEAGGASDSPCAGDFRGSSPGDAPETRVLSAFMRRLGDRRGGGAGIKLFIDFHAYSQMVMMPYGWSCMEAAARGDEMLRLAEGATEAIYRVHGTGFQAGSICWMLYKATGNAADYANDVVGAEYSYTIELRDTGRNGFVLGPEEIRPSGEEAWAGVRFLLMNLK